MRRKPRSTVSQTKLRWSCFGLGVLVLAGCSSTIISKASVAEVTRPTTIAPATSYVVTTTTVGSTGDSNGEAGSTSAPKAVESRFGDFRMTIPPDWILLTPSAEELSSLGEKVTGTLTGVTGTALVEDAESIAASTALWAQSPGPSAFNENIQVIRLARQPEVTLQSLTETAVGQLTTLGLVDIVTNEVPVDGLAGVKISSRTGSGTIPRLFQASVFLIDAEHVWVINFAADDESELETFNAMLESFQLLIPSN